MQMLLSVRNPVPPIVQKPKHQSSKPRFWGHLLLLKKATKIWAGYWRTQRRYYSEGSMGGCDRTGEVVLLKQNDGAISASHTSWDRRAPRLTLGAIIEQHSWHQIWMVFDPWHLFRNAAVAQRPGHGSLLIRLLTSGSFSATWSTDRWTLTSGKTGKNFYTVLIPL